MNKNLIALAGLLAVCGFMTGCCKKKCEPRSDQRHDTGKKKHHAKKGGRYAKQHHGHDKHGRDLYK